MKSFLIADNKQICKFNYFKNNFFLILTKASRCSLGEMKICPLQLNLDVIQISSDLYVTLSKNKRKER